MSPSLHRALPFAAGIVGILLLTALWYYTVKYPPCCDAQGYLVMARSYLGWDPASADLFTELKAIRTYGYPGFLVPLLVVAKWLGANAALVIFLVQIFLYWAASWWLASEYGHLYGQPAGRYARYALLGNAIIYPLLAVPLTDGVAVVLLFLMLATAMRWLRVQAAAQEAAPWHLLYVLPFGMLTAFAIMVRPSNLAFAGVAFVAFLFTVVISMRKHGRSPDIWLAALLMATGFLLVVAPQLSINVTNYGIWSILPKADLAAGSVEWAKSVLKYVTNLSGTVAETQQCYRAPWPIPPGAGLSWYLVHPVEGFKTAALHLFGALDYDYFFPYVYDLKPAYRPALFLYVHPALFLGTVGFVARAMEARLTRWSATDFLIAASLSYILLWTGIQWLVHAEVRYSIAVSSLLLLFLPHGVAVVARHRKRLLPLFAAYLVVAWLLSHFLAGLMAPCNIK